MYCFSGYIPAPIIFGSIIDTACLLWRENCGGSTGVCLLYDIEQFRYKYIGEIMCGCGNTVYFYYVIFSRTIFYYGALMLRRAFFTFYC